MTLEEQRQIMLSGAMYNDLTPELIRARENAVRLADAYNRSFGGPAGEREAILRRLLKSIGKGVHFEPDFRCEFGFNISIGNNFYANFDCVMLDGGGIEIGDNVLLGPNVQIIAATHPTDPKIRLMGLECGKPVTIGANVWLGAGVTVCPGVTIGENTTIGAGSVVNRDIPAGVLAVGNPCRPVRSLQERGE